MKKLTVLLTVLIILSHISTCSFAFEMTEDECSAYNFVSEFLHKYYSNVHQSTDYNVLKYTIAYLDDSQKNEILEKAKEYENEIRDNHHYRLYADRQDYWETADADGDGVIQSHEVEPIDPNKRPVCKQYDNMAIEEVITSFPIFFSKKIQYKNVNEFFHNRDTRNYYFEIPLGERTVTVSESGFAYIHTCCSKSYYENGRNTDILDDLDILLYRFTDGTWVVCDVSSYYEESDELYRFRYEYWDVEEELSSFVQANTPSTESDNDTERADESENKAQDSSKESKPRSFASEATDDEQSAYKFASEFLDKYYSNVYYSTEYDVSEGTVAHLDDSRKNEILEKAKEYEDEIRDNHRYVLGDDYKDILNEDVIASLLADPDKKTACKQYDNAAIEDVITSFPVFFEKIAGYKNGCHIFFNQKYDTRDYLFKIQPGETTVSESGFAYIHTRCNKSYNYDNYKRTDRLEREIGPDFIDILLYKFTDGTWVVCDVSYYLDNCYEVYRFKPESWDVEESLSSLESKNRPSTESDNKAQDSPNESEPTGYIPWVICGIEAVAVIALVITLVLKKKK